MFFWILSKLPRPNERQCAKKLGRGLPLPPHPQIDPIYTVCEKWTKNFGRALPPSIGQNPKEQLLFSGDRPYKGNTSMEKKTFYFGHCPNHLSSLIVIFVIRVCVLSLLSHQSYEEVTVGVHTYTYSIHWKLFLSVPKMRTWLGWGLILQVLVHGCHPLNCAANFACWSFFLQVQNDTVCKIGVP